MPSPSSPLEYRPTPHLVLLVFFFVFPLIYFCSRIAATIFCVVAYTFKSVFSHLLQFLYKEDSHIKVTRMKQRAVPPSTPTSSVISGIIEESCTDEMTEESDQEVYTLESEDQRPPAVDNLKSQSEQTESQVSEIAKTAQPAVQTENDSGNEDDLLTLSSSHQ